VISAAATAHFP